MWKSNQPGSELDRTLNTSTDPFAALTAVREPENTTESLDTRRSRPLNVTQVRPCVTAKESGISYSSAEKNSNLRYPETTGDQSFSPVETPTESHKSDAVKSSSEAFQKRNIYTIKGTDAEPYPAAFDTISPLPRDEKKYYKKRLTEKEKNVLGLSRQSSHPVNEAIPRHLSQHQSSHSHNNNMQRANLLHHVQDTNETCPSREIISSSLKLQKNTQRQETTPPKRRNAYSNRVVTTLPPIQHRTRNTPVHSRHSQTLAEQRSEVLPYFRRYGRQEVGEVRNAEYRPTSRRHGVCKETDITQAQRTFVRVLGKRF